MTSLRAVEFDQAAAPRDKLLLTAAEAAAALSLSRRTVYELLSKGALRSVKIGRSRRIPRRALEEYVAMLTDSAWFPTVQSGRTT